MTTSATAGRESRGKGSIAFSAPYAARSTTGVSRWSWQRARITSCSGSMIAWTAKRRTNHATRKSDVVMAPDRERPRAPHRASAGNQGGVTHGFAMAFHRNEKKPRSAWISVVRESPSEIRFEHPPSRNVRVACRATRTRRTRPRARRAGGELDRDEADGTRAAFREALAPHARAPRAAPARRAGR